MRMTAAPIESERGLEIRPLIPSVVLTLVRAHTI